MEEEGNEILSRNKEGNLGGTAQKARLLGLSQERNRAKSTGFISNSGSFQLLLTLNEDQLGSACLPKRQGPSSAGRRAARTNGPGAAGSESPRTAGCPAPRGAAVCSRGLSASGGLSHGHQNSR